MNKNPQFWLTWNVGEKFYGFTAQISRRGRWTENGKPMGLIAFSKTKLEEYPDIVRYALYFFSLSLAFNVVDKSKMEHHNANT